MASEDGKHTFVASRFKGKEDDTIMNNYKEIERICRSLKAAT